MQELVERIRTEGRNLGRGILKVDGFINHRLEPSLTLNMGKHFAARFAEAGVSGITKIVTAEVSGIAPALTTGMALDVPIVYARKTRPITMIGRTEVGGTNGAEGVYQSSAPSHTKGGITNLIISPEYLLASDKVLLIDDFLASGKTIAALVDLIQQCGAQLAGIGCVIEKSFEEGRKSLEHLGVPIVSLAIIDSMDGDDITVRDAAPINLEAV